MASKVKVTVACDDYELVQPLIDGRVTADGVDLVMRTDMTVAERHERFLHDLAFDVCELGAPTYFLARDRGLPLTAMPIFLLRRFRHGDIFINRDAGITEPADLIGKKVGGLSYQVASNVWARGILAERYGVPHDSIAWVVQRPEEVKFDPPPGLRIEIAPPGTSLEAMLLSGAIDGLILPVVPKSILEGDRRVGRLFPNYKEVEISYYRETGIFPIMHVNAVKRDLVEKHPSVLNSLRRAFDQAKDLAYKRMANVRAVPLAWFASAWQEERETLGPDPWRYGLGQANTRTIETLLRYVRNQGMIRQETRLEDLFLDPPGAVATSAADL